MDKELFKDLLDKYVMEIITAEETRQLFQLLQLEDYQLEMKKFIDGYFEDADYQELENPQLRDAVQARLQEVIRQPKDVDRVIQLPGKISPVIPFYRKWRMAGVAAVLVVLLGGVYLFIMVKAKNSPAPMAGIEQRFKNDIAPGGNKAVLTLANGRKVVLDSVANGVLAGQGPVKVLKLDSGKLAYNVLHEKPTAIMYNTLTTPPGGQYQLILSDGSKVWLDAASSITYPTYFMGDERKVAITGQAYFEVARNEKLPFIVQKGEMQVKVLGTHFNVNAYEDETSIRTTLLEGAVEVIKGPATTMLGPGQQAQLTKDGEISLINNADVDAAIAWKTGVFQYKATDIETVMRQVARWYNVDVQYEGGKVKQTFYGIIPRTVSAANVFRILEETGGVHFRIDGKKVVVMP
ncbi:MAG TPA: FecR domain-containing protein [Puia sp.]